ncbi:MAG TPA: hypothetical protein VKA94_13105, partial [Hyphomicrobiales bacterium]|nr:hypothetical protein [Hyphomicrobiales bacterium]
MEHFPACARSSGRNRHEIATRMRAVIPLNSRQFTANFPVDLHMPVSLVLDYADLPARSILNDRGAGKIIAILFKIRFLAAAILHDAAGIKIAILFYLGLMTVTGLIDIGIIAGSILGDPGHILALAELQSLLRNPCFVRDAVLSDDGRIETAVAALKDGSHIA